MKYNLWIHVRLAGAVVLIVGGFIPSLEAILFGTALLAYGTIMGLTRLERLMEELCHISKNNDEQK